MFGIETIDGLPLHALIVHVPVMLLPLSAAAFIATGWNRDWRSRYGLAIALLAIGAAIGAFVATATGEVLEHTIEQAARASGQRANLGDHPEDGELARNVAIAFALISAAVWAVDYRLKTRLPAWTPTALYGLGSLVGLVAIFAIVSAGHSGAALVWRDLGNYVTVSKR